MFLEFEERFKNKDKKTYIFIASSYPELLNKFRYFVKKKSDDINIIQIKYTKSDCFNIKNGYCEDLEKVLKKSFSTSA